MNRLDGKRVVITGAASGLGRALALALARKGCRIGVVDINVEGAQETLRMVERAGGSGDIYELDVSRPDKVEAMAEHFFSSWGGVELLVNNAGVVVTGCVGDIRLEDWEWLFGVNFWGMLYGCHSFIPRMKKQGGGHILNIASEGGIIFLPWMAPYNTSKAGIVSLSMTLKAELATEGIGVTVACPAFFSTHLLDNMRYEDEFETEFAHATFEHARMTADEVAEAAIRAVEKGRLFCIPQPSARIGWVIERLNPGLFQASLAALIRQPWGKSLFMWLARRGLLQ